MSTTLYKGQSERRQWLLVDAKGKVLGRLASRLALILRGKHKPDFIPYIDTGDFVVVINAAQVALTGRKLTQKTYARYTGYSSGHRTERLDELLRKHPERVIQSAVKGMMPDGPLGRRMLKKLKVYAGSEHPHQAQKLTPLNDRLVGAKNGRS